MAKCIVLGNGSGGGVDCTNAQAIASHVLLGRTFGKGETLVTGSMPNNGNVSISIPRNGQYTIPVGYHGGSGVVKGDVLPSQGAVTHTPFNTTIGSNYTVVPAGRYMTGDVTIKGSPNLIAANIKQGVTIFGIAGQAVE